MKPPKEVQALAEVAGKLQDFLDANVRSGTHDRVDAVVHAAGHRFAVEWKAASTVVAVQAAIELLRAALDEEPEFVALLAVPYMGPSGRQACEVAGVSWLDLSGNARIKAKGLNVHVEGRPNLFKSQGRPASVFAPKSSRIVRQLILDPRPMNMLSLATTAGVDPGQASRVIGRLLSDGYIDRDGNGLLSVVNRDALLKDWRAAYSFRKHDVVAGHLAAQDGIDLARQLSDPLRAIAHEHAFTGLVAAWAYTQFAAFRLVTVFVKDLPRALSRFEDLGFREGGEGANVWVAQPNDELLSNRWRDVEDLACVHPLQAWLDLKDHPERSAEAAESIVEAGLFGDKGVR